MRKKHNQNTYMHGTHNAVCDVCGFKFKAVDLRRRWDGVLCCHDDWEERHPLDFSGEIREEKGVSDPNPEPEPRFRVVPYLE